MLGTRGKGRILRAKRPFKKGDLVFEEGPLSSVLKVQLDFMPDGLCIALDGRCAYTQQSSVTLRRKLKQEPPLHIVVADESNEAFKVITRVCETREAAVFGFSKFCTSPHCSSPGCGLQAAVVLGGVLFPDGRRPKDTSKGGVSATSLDARQN